MRASQISSWLLVGGIAIGFLLASWAGQRAAATSRPESFQRFHQRISPDALFYPPYAMLETLALEHWQPGQTLVIVGGNSILNGVGQPLEDLWSRRLQENLGAEYVVVNLALRSAYPTQAGALVAEALRQKGYPVIYVTNTNPVAGCGLAAAPPYGYLYWQALALGRLPDFPARDTRILSWVKTLPPTAQREVAETRLAGRLEPWFHAQSLWHEIGYRHFFTVWNFILGSDFLSPRRQQVDFEASPPPVRERFRYHLEEELAIIRGMTAGLADMTSEGHWHLSESARRKLEEEIESGFCPELRPNTLLLLDGSCPYYLEKLTPDERTRNQEIYTACADVWRSHGIACAITGLGFISKDYTDRAHLSGTGGRKLADLVAANIRAIRKTPTR